MKTTLARNEKLLMIAILSLGVLFVGLFAGVSLKPDSVSGFEARAGYINYEMGRPTESYSEYTLNGRDVDHSYESLKAREVAKLKEATKTAEAAKKAELTKKEVVKKAAVANTTQAKAHVVAAVSKPVSITTNPHAVTSAGYQGSYSAGNYAQAVPSSPEIPTDKKADKDKKSFAQWRAQMFAAPTRETLALFIEAYRKGELTTTEFQSMAQDLLEQTDEKYKGLGILALRAQPSLQSLSQLAHLNESSLSKAMQTYLNEAITAYMQEANISVVNQALQTKDKVLISKTLTLLNSSLPKISQGDYSSLVDSRNRRDSASTMTMASFKVLLPSLAALFNAGDADLARLAQVCSGYIQSTNHIAQN